MMGGSVRIENEVEYKLVFQKRVSGVDFNRKLTESEEKLVGATYEVLRASYMHDSTRKEKCGLSYKSPSGKPQVRFSNGEPLSQTYSFSFSVDVPESHNMPLLFTYNGTAYPTFKCTHIGGHVLQLAEREKSVVCFGYSTHGDEITLFYQRLKHRVSSHTMNYTDQKLIRTTSNGISIICNVAKDLTPISLDQLQIEYNTGINQNYGGDPVAVLNYGNYFNTRNRSATITMKRLLNRLGSDIPHQAERYKPQYPYFPETVFAFPMAKNNLFIGSKSICKLKLTWCANPEFKQQISLATTEPVIVPLQNSGDEYEPLWE